MKKVFFKNSKDVSLAGVFNFPENKSDSVLLMAHGFTSGKDRPRMLELAKRIAGNGFVVFRFDFGGHGESEDRIITIKDQVDDFRSAIDFVISQGYKKVGIFGSSFGGLCSILAYSDKVDAMILWAANTKPYFSPLYTEEAKREIEEKGYIDFGKPSEKFKIGEDYFVGAKNIDQEKLLSGIEIPVLVLHGDEDELVPLQDSKDALKFLSEGSRLKVIHGAGHGFGEHLDEVGKLIGDWLGENF